MSLTERSYHDLLYDGFLEEAVAPAGPAAPREVRPSAGGGGLRILSYVDKILNVVEFIDRTDRP